MNKTKESRKHELPGTHTILPLPTAEKRALVQAEISEALRDAVQDEMTARKLKWREVLEWSLGVYLMNVNPEEAEKLGFKRDK